jgi:hypothetical protein
MPGMKSLTGMGGTGGAMELAEMLRQMGRGRDTVLAHITPEEAQMLLDMGGSGTTNPNTGLPEFQEDYFGEEFTPDYSGFASDQSYMGVPQAGQEVDLSSYAQPAQPAQQLPQDFDFRLASEQANRGLTPTGVRPTGFDISTGQGMGFREYPVSLGYPQGAIDVATYGANQMTPEQVIASRSTVQEPGFLRTAAQAVEDTASQARQLAREYPTVARLLSTGATTLPSLIAAVRARRDAQKSADQFRRLGEPLRAQGEALRQQAIAGGLTPQQAAQQEAQRARLRQQASGRGATTGTQQAMIEGQLSRQRSELGQTNLNNAVKLLNLANAYDEEAIRTTLAANQRINQSLGNVFANLGQAAATSVVPPSPEPQSQRVTQRPQVRE